MSVKQVRYWHAECPECGWKQVHESLKAAIVDLSLHMEERHEGRMGEQDVECPGCGRTAGFVTDTHGRWMVALHDNRRHDGHCHGSLFPHIADAGEPPVVDLGDRDPGDEIILGGER